MSQVISYIVIEALSLRLGIQMPLSLSQQLMKITVCSALYFLKGLSV
jgi:hypothetical protein